MSLNEHDQHARCDTCDRIAFEPKPCVECAKVDHAARYCESHRHHCVICGEDVCEAHRAEHAAMCVNELGEREMDVCPECEGRRYDAASYRRAKHPDQIEDCGTCGGTGEVPVATEPEPVTAMNTHQMQRALIAAAMARGAEIGPLVEIGRPLESTPRYRGRVA